MHRNPLKSLKRLGPSIRLVFAGCAMAGLPALAAPATAATPDTDVPAAEKPTIDAHADALLRRMGDYLAQAPFFSVSAEVWQDVQLASGQRAQAGRTIDLQVRRPNRLHAEVRSTRRNRGLYYDGATITLLNRVHDFYGVIPAPASLDEAVDAACERFGITMPLEDLIVSDPYHNAISNVVSAVDLGPVTVLDVPCEHLVFSQATIDWQLWIEEGPTPLPRKIVITYKDEEGSPQYTAIFSRWDLQTKLPDFLFHCEPPPGAAKIDVAEIKQENLIRKSEGKKP